MAKSYPEYSYDLADEILEALAPFRADGIIALAEGEGGLAPRGEDFRRAGVQAALAAVEAGRKYRDRTGEVIDMVAARTGLPFPSVMQRYLEIWLLCTGHAQKWKLREAVQGGIVYEVGQCLLLEKAADRWPGLERGACSGYCTGTLETMAEKLGMGIAVKREGLPEGGCRFIITPK